MTAVTMKTIVAMERGDSRAIPQMPCPEVQPPSREPKPTSSPATTMTAQLAGSFGRRHAVADQPAMTGARMSPAIKAMRQPLFAPQIQEAEDTADPAIRPVDNISSTAESLIRAPPMAADRGGNWP